MLKKTPEKRFRKKSPFNELLKKEQETILFKELEKARKNNDKKEIKKISDQIFILNHKLLILIIHKLNFFLTHLNTEDLIQESTFGLYEAIEKFNYRLGNSFSTYARYWIKRSVYKQIKTTERTVRIPKYMKQLINFYNKAETNLTKKLNRKPTLEELSNELAWNTEKMLKIETVMTQYSFIKSTEKSLLVGSGRVTILDTIPDNKQNNQLANKDLSTLIEKIFKTPTLNAREKEILMLKFGINETKKPMHSKDIGEIFGITQERVGQIKKTALEKLKKVFEKKGIIFTDYI